MSETRKKTPSWLMPRSSDKRTLEPKTYTENDAIQTIASAIAYNILHELEVSSAELDFLKDEVKRKKYKTEILDDMNLRRGILVTLREQWDEEVAQGHLNAGNSHTIDTTSSLGNLFMAKGDRNKRGK